MDNLTAGDVFRLVLKKEKLTQTEFSDKIGVSKRNVNAALRNFDENKGQISKLVDYADKLGYEVKFDFVKKEK